MPLPPTSAQNIVAALNASESPMPPAKLWLAWTRRRRTSKSSSPATTTTSSNVSRPLPTKRLATKPSALPFTKQWNHERELEKAGRQPKFGSYKYSARQLADKGVLLQWHAYPMDNWTQLNVVISSDEVGRVPLEASSGSMMLPGASANILLDDLLQAQYDNRNTIGHLRDGAGGPRSRCKTGSKPAFASGVQKVLPRRLGAILFGRLHHYSFSVNPLFFRMFS